MTEGVPAIVPVLTTFADALDYVMTQGIPPDTPPEHSGEWLGTVRHVREALAVLDRDLEAHTAARMAGETLVLSSGRVVIKSRRPAKVEWDRDRARTVVIAEVVRQIALDPVTGELDPVKRWAATEALARIQHAYTLGDPKMGMSHLGLDGREYRATTPQGWKVDVK